MTIPGRFPPFGTQDAKGDTAARSPMSIASLGVLFGRVGVFDGVSFLKTPSGTGSCPVGAFETTQKKWRKLNGSNHLAEIIRGLKFVDGERQDRAAA